MTIHTKFADQVKRTCAIDYDGPDFSEGYHVYSLIWDPTVIQFFVDGQLKREDYKYNTLQGQNTCTIGAFEHYLLNLLFPVNPMSIVLNTAIKYNQISSNENDFPVQMEVDWVRYYKRGDCSKKNLTNSNPIVLNPNNINYNSISGTEIIVFCNYTQSKNQQLDLVARNTIEIYPGFTINDGANFEARISPSLCVKSKSEKIKLQENEDIEKITNPLKNSREVIVYPNPSTAIFTIDFGSEEYQNNIVKLTNQLGEIIPCPQRGDRNQLTIDMSDQAPGIYHLHLVNKETHAVQHHKITHL